MQPARSRSSVWRAIPVAFALVAGCGPARTTETPPAPKIGLGDTVDDGVTKSGWHYHPREMGEVHDAVLLEDGRWLLVAGWGERFRAQRPRNPREVPFAEAALHRAPEPLIRIVRRGANRWLFVGRSGATYTSDSPLGPLEMGAAPPRPLAAVAGTDKTLIGVGALGELSRFDGQRWTRSQSACTCSGCIDAGGCRRVFDVEANGAGQLLALALPEALLMSEDGGAKWTPIDKPPRGAYALARGRRGAVVVRGALDDMAWTGKALAKAGADAIEQPPFLEQLLTWRGPRAVAVEERSASFTASGYVEVFDDPDGLYGGKTSEQGGPHWMIASGSLGHGLRVRPLPLPTHCDAIRVAAADEQVVLACLAEDDEEVRVTLLCSHDGGGSFARQAALHAPDDDVDVAVSPAGRALITGVCVPGEAHGCRARQPLGLAPGGKPKEVRAGDLTDRASAPTFSVDGKSAYFFGRRAKDEHVALYVSRDGGHTFGSRSIEPPKSSLRGWDTNGDIARAIVPGRDGALGLLLEQAPPTYAVADADGRILSVAHLPQGAMSVSGQGRHVMALSTAESHGDMPLQLVVWESTDGGHSFHLSPLPMRLEVDEFVDPLSVQCGAEACVVGSKLTRIGMGGDSPAGAPTGASPDIDREMVPALATPIACRAQAPNWETITDVEPTQVPAPRSPLLPEAAQALRGPSAWTLLRVDEKRWSVVALSAPLKRPPRGTALERYELLGPVSERDRYAYHLSRQMEGYAAVRARLPSGPTGGASMKLELAWVNYLNQTDGQAELDAGHFVTADVTPPPRPHLLAEVVSVSPSGLVVRPSGSRAETYVLDNGGRLQTEAAYPDWPSIAASRSRDEAVVVDGHAFAVGVHARRMGVDSVVSLAPLSPAGPARFTTIAPEPGFGRSVETGWTYLGGEVGIAVQVMDDNRMRGYATYRGFTSGGELGAEVPLPTQLDLAAAPTPCTQEQRRRSARVVASWVVGARHPVLIRSSLGDDVLLTGAAILHGTPTTPCVAGWHADSLARHEPKVAIVSGDLSRAWVFRETPGHVRSVEVQELTCQWAPDATLPDSIWQEPGAERPR